MAGLTAAELEAVVGVDDSPFSAGLDRMLGMFEGWGGKAGKVLAGVGALGGGLFAAGLASAMTLADVRAQIESELGVSATKAEELGNVAGNLYANAFGGSLEETSAAVTTVVSSIKGMRQATDAEVEAMTAKAMTFADVFEVDVARAAQVAGQAVQSGLAKNAGQAFDLLTATMQQVPKNVREDVMDAADEYGPFFASLGIKGEAAFGMLAKGAEKGMYGIDKTGDALKEFTIRASDGSDASQTAFQSIGVNAQKMTEAFAKGGPKASAAFDKVVDGLLDIENPAKRANTAIALFGVPLEDLGVNDIPKFLRGLKQGGKGLGDFAGATDKMVEATGSTPSANLTAFGRTLKQATVGVIGGAVIPALTSVTGALTDGLGSALASVGIDGNSAGKALEKFGGFVSDNQTPLMVVAGIIAAVFLPHLIALGVQSLIAGAKSVAGWAMTQAGAIRAAVVHSGAVVAMVGGWVLMGVQAMAQAARMAAAWLIAMGPVGWVIGIIALLVGAFVLAYKKSETFRDIVNGAMHAVADAGKWMWEKVLRPAFGYMVDGFQALGRAGTWLWNNALQPAFRFIIGGVAGILHMWASMLRALSNVPGFGWAEKAANALDGAADKARGLADGINKIPTSKQIDVHIDYFGETHGVRPGGKGFGPVPMATGGRATGATYALIGEGAEPESVLPDSVLRGLLERAHDAGASKGDDRRGGLMRDVVFNGREGASARELIGELTRALRIAEHGGVYA